MSSPIRYDKFWAGISQDDRLVREGEYLYGRDIAIRNGQFLELEKKPDSLTAVSEPWSINCSFYNGKWFLWCSDGHIRTTTDFVTYTDVYTLPDTWVPFAMIWAGTNLFIWVQWYMYYRTNYTDWNPWVTSTNAFQVAIENSPNRQVIHYSSKLVFFTNGTKIGYVSTDAPWTVVDYGSFTSGGWAFQARSELVWLTEHANSFWAYDASGRMYVIDQSIQAVTSVKNFKEPIIGVYNNSDYDIVITQSWVFYKAMYLNGWVWPNSHELFRRYVYSTYVYNVLNGNTVWDGFRFNFVIKESKDFSFSENNTIVYFVANEWGEDVVYSFGQKNGSLPRSLSIVSSKREDGSSYWTISAIWTYASNLYIAWNDGVTRYVEALPIEDQFTGAEYQPEWYIVTRADSAWVYEKTKKIVSMLEGSDIPAWTTTEISYSINEWDFTPLTTINSSWVLWWTNTDIGKIIQRAIPQNPFNEIAFKIKLTTTNSSISPRLFSLETLVNLDRYNPPD